MLKRSQTSDLLKGISVLLMIQVHIIELFATQEINQSTAGKFLLFLGGPFVAPVFVLLMGYYVAASKRPFNELIIRGVKLFVLGMFLNVALNLNLIIKVSNGLLNLDLLPYLFGVDILHFSGISIVVLACFKRLFEKNWLFILLAIFLSGAVTYTLSEINLEHITAKYLSSFIFGSSSWSYFPLFPWLVYPLLGFMFYRLQIEFNLSWLYSVRMKILTGFLFPLFLFFTFNYAVNISSQLSSYYHHTILFVSWMMVFLSLYSHILFQINTLTVNSLFFKYLRWLGKNVTILYVVQWIIIGNIATEIYKTVGSPLVLIISILSITAASSLISYLLIQLKERLRL